MDNQRIKKYLNGRGISDEVIITRRLSFDGRIVIPIFSKDGTTLFNKYRRDPDSGDTGPKYSYDKGAKSSLYGIDLIASTRANPDGDVIICEGELDALVLLSNGFRAVTSTGGAGTFLPEWAPLCAGKMVYICLDNDQAGRLGAVKISKLIPHAKMIPLPFEVKDITDYFKHHTKEQFVTLMNAAFVLELPPEPVARPKSNRRSAEIFSEFERAKAIPIREYLKTDHEGFASCPFHKEKTASLKVDKHNRFYCYGCTKWGDVIDIVRQLYNIRTTKEAVNYILKK